MDFVGGVKKYVGNMKKYPYYIDSVTWKNSKISPSTGSETLKNSELPCIDSGTWKNYERSLKPRLERHET